MEKLTSEEVALKFVDKINSRDADGLAELMTEDFVLVDYEGETVEGRDVMRDGFAEYFARFPGYRILIEKICVSGSDVAFIAKTKGSHVPSELEENEALIFVATIIDGLVAQWRIYTDLEDVRERIRKRDD
jgi:uncharacterized protein (TIGR02246 family)